MHACELQAWHLLVAVMTVPPQQLRQAEAPVGLRRARHDAGGVRGNHPRPGGKASDGSWLRPPETAIPGEDLLSLPGRSPVPLHPPSNSGLAVHTADTSPTRLAAGRGTCFQEHV